MKATRGGVWLFLMAALIVALWGGATWGWEAWQGHGRSLAAHLFFTQDMPALMLGGGALLLGAGAMAWGGGGNVLEASWVRRRGPVVALITVAALAVWLGQKALFHGYFLSRDEEVADMASAIMARCRLAMPIPAEWVDLRRAIMPEFFLPFGADHSFAAAYLPVNSAGRAAFRLIGDATLAGPAWMALGLFALWRCALRLFPDRNDAVLVVLVMALSSVQLLLTAMTPYAMTAHFALNMVWLALVLRDTRTSHMGAGVVAILTAGLHQWHFPLIFLLPFLPWFALRRRWGLMLFHTGMIVVAVVIWAKLWPMTLHDLLGPPADVQPAKGVGDKMGSLFSRLDKWHPLLHLSRFLAWNNLLLLPLAAWGVWAGGWRAMLRGENPALPLALGCLGAMAVAIDQGYGWGYRYLHGYIGSFALLAAYGWTRLRATSPRAIGLSVLIAILTGSFLVGRAAGYVTPYVRAHQLIHASDADVVIVDPRGGRFVTDLVRGADGNPLGRPVVLSLGMLRVADVDRLCATKRVAIFDQSAFLPLGVSAMPWGNAYMGSLRARMTARGCGTLLTAPR